MQCQTTFSGRGECKSFSSTFSFFGTIDFRRSAMVAWKSESPTSSSPSRPLEISNVGWDPEGILANPQVGHIARRQRQRSLAEEEAIKEAEEKERRKEEERRRAIREARIVPDSSPELIEFFLQTEVQEIEYEIARCRPFLNEGFFQTLRTEKGQIRFKERQTSGDLERLGELEALESALLEGVGAYDRLAETIFSRKETLEKIFLSKEKKATILELSTQNLLDRPLLALLDQNILAAQTAGEAQAVEFMEKLRGAIVKYITL